ncbi:MAG: metallophosphoesterase [Ruminococcus sp.]
MKKKLKFVIVISVVACAFLTAFILFGGKSQSAKIIVATDIHYLSSRINDKGNAFFDTVNNADGKLVQYCDEIFSAFGDEVIKSQPDVLILSGDLTFNGEKASHEDLIKKLNEIHSKGVQVLTIPGNHDIDSTSACGFKDDEYYQVDCITAEEYRKLYYDFGMKQAQSVDENSFSYLYKVNKDLYVLMLDTNTFGENFVQDESYQWIEEQLKMVKLRRAQVITVTHQNLFAHNEQLSFGYQLYDADELLETLNKYKVQCNLSGHIHMQHIKSDGVTEIATSSLLVSPVQYGVINFDGDINYQTKSVDVSAWAKDNKLTNEKLLNFSAYAEGFFKENIVKRSLMRLENAEMSNEDKKLIAKTFSELNASYFAGSTIDISKMQKGIDLCKKQDGFLSKYIETMADEATIDHTSMTIWKAKTSPYISRHSKRLKEQNP